MNLFLNTGKGTSSSSLKSASQLSLRQMTLKQADIAGKKLLNLADLLLKIESRLNNPQSQQGCLW
jgi:hypothetical protein